MAHHPSASWLIYLILLIGLWFVLRHTPLDKHLKTYAFTGKFTGKIYKKCFVRFDIVRRNYSWCNFGADETGLYILGGGPLKSIRVPWSDIIVSACTVWCKPYLRFQFPSLNHGSISIPVDIGNDLLKDAGKENLLKK